jgi:phage internal scaffolding protein
MSYRWREYCNNNPEINPRDKNALKALYKLDHITKLNPDGTIKYLTEQSSKDECDINKIIAKYPARVIESKMKYDEAKFADVSGIDFQNSLNLVKEVESNFLKLPVDIRNTFQNSPEKYLDFLQKEGQVNLNDVKEIYDPKRVKDKNAISMKDKDKDGIPDKLQEKKKKEEETD